MERLGERDTNNKELIYSNKDNDGNTIELYEGASLKNYPPDIKEKDKVMYILTTGMYRYKFADQDALLNAVLRIVVRPERRREKAQHFIDVASKYLY